MNTTHDDRWVDGDAMADIDAAPRNAGNRRVLLGGAGVGLALAASGLFLPERQIEEAEASEGALGGAKGEGHGKHRRGKKQKRKDRKPGDIVPTKSGILVYNERAAPVQTRGLQRDPHAWSVIAGWDWAAIPGKTGGGSPNIRRFTGEYGQVVVQIGTDRVVRIDFTWPIDPYVFIYSGGWEYDGWRPVGKELANEKFMSIGKSISVPGITAKRISDTSSNVWLEVILT